MDKTIRVAGAKNKAATKLKRILPQLVLMMTCGARAFPARSIIFAQKMQQICRREPRGSISPALLVDQQWKRDAGLLAEQPRIVTITQSDGGKRSTFLAEGVLAFAQLRDVLAAKDSSVVPQEYDYGGTAGPQRAESNFAPIGIGKQDIRQLAAERLLHGGSILRSVNSTVKARAIHKVVVIRPTVFKSC